MLHTKFDQIINLM